MRVPGAVDRSLTGADVLIGGFEVQREVERVGDGSIQQVHVAIPKGLSTVRAQVTSLPRARATTRRSGLVHR